MQLECVWAHRCVGLCCVWTVVGVWGLRKRCNGADRLRIHERAMGDQACTRGAVRTLSGLPRAGPRPSGAQRVALPSPSSAAPAVRPPRPRARQGAWTRWCPRPRSPSVSMSSIGLEWRGCVSGCQGVSVFDVRVCAGDSLFSTHAVIHVRRPSGSQCHHDHTSPTNCTPAR